ncbi:small ribosomal subunit biogenesis GTPase RsgA 1, mitochondrial isoform X2 [Cryptomeria japonica]|uniref:small ribosomal subunit biogenesis GTPase RsgA 1, mitochondrial isoform X2 n=1 Tax=Cryptomeria japonica TaxID=3369 RepID=UPI0027DA7969|nr:small ribosomal subunit biogenesis GTPase RsgA 1, mitochondrial isoform X2 [Cryptomeria japonica]
MPIDISLVASCAKMSIHHSIPHLHEFSFCSFSRNFSTGLTVVYPIQERMSLGFCHKHNALLTRILASKNPAKPRRRIKTQSDRNWLKAKHSVKQAAEPLIISEQFSSEEDVDLGERQAIGVAVSAQANFMRVIVKKAGGVGGFGEERKPSLKENGAPGNFIDSDKNIRVIGGINKKTVNGVLKTSGKISGTDDNSYGRNPVLVSAINADETSRTLHDDRGRNSDSHDRVEGRAAMDVRSVSHETESEDGDNVHKGAEDLGENNKKCVDKRVGLELLCVVRALLKKIKRRVLVGDKVLVGSIDWTDKRGMIEDVFERKSEITDPPVANVDHMLLLFSMDQPKLEPFIMTRFLVEAESLEIPFTLVMNKTDLVEEEVLHAWKDRLQSWGYEALYCSADSNLGLTAVANVLEKRTSVVVGPSGVGKSSLINALRRGLDICATSEMDLFAGQVGQDSKWFEELRIGDISMRSGRGKHTTRNVTLLPLPSGGYLTDTPGFNQPSLLKATKNSLAWMFPEIRQMLSSDSGRCLFNDCLHIGEKGCAVKADWERYPYYLQLLDEIKIREEIQLRLIGTKRESDVRYKVREMGVKQAEPRLEPKKHRRQSRKSVKQSIMEELGEALEDGKY